MFPPQNSHCCSVAITPIPAKKSNIGPSSTLDSNLDNSSCDILPDSKFSATFPGTNLDRDEHFVEQVLRLVVGVNSHLWVSQETNLFQTVPQENCWRDHKVLVALLECCPFFQTVP
jgi:hypothetical protein